MKNSDESATCRYCKRSIRASGSWSGGRTRYGEVANGESNCKLSHEPGPTDEQIETLVIIHLTDLFDNYVAGCATFGHSPNGEGFATQAGLEVLAAVDDYVDGFEQGT